ncbi:ethylene receptor [Hordeum vulgare]|nr:ethylene receptor [Hordeum vulgare]
MNRVDAELSAKSFAVMVLMLPPDSARKWRTHEVELVEVVADQLSNGSLELDIAPFDLHATFTDVVNLIKPVAACKRLSVMVSLAPELPACAIGDRKLLMQIMLNVAGNSIKFTKEGHVSIAASIARVPGGEFSGSCRLPGGRFIGGGGFSASGGLSGGRGFSDDGGFNGGSGIPGGSGVFLGGG